MTDYRNPRNELGLGKGHRQLLPLYTIKEYRLAMNMTQPAMANTLGVALRTYKTYESGESEPPPYMEAALRYFAYTHGQRKRKDNMCQVIKNFVNKRLAELEAKQQKIILDARAKATDNAKDLI